MRDLFRVALVHLAAVGFNEEFRHGWAEIIHWAPGSATAPGVRRAIITLPRFRLFQIKSCSRWETRHRRLALSGAAGFIKLRGCRITVNTRSILRSEHLPM